MFANTITLPFPSGNKVLTRINQDGYASEYLYRDSLIEYNLKIRHTKVNPSKGRSEVYDRHNVELVKTTFKTETVPQYDRKVYFVLENKPGDNAVDEADGLFDYSVASTDAFLTALGGWES